MPYTFIGSEKTTTSPNTLTITPDTSTQVAAGTASTITCYGGQSSDSYFPVKATFNKKAGYATGAGVTITEPL